jgi:hypothetical protein
MKNTDPEIDPKTGRLILRGHISYDGPECCQIAVYCPYCGCNHFHGWPTRRTDTEYLEHRIAHCFDTPDRLARNSPFNRGGYLIGIGQSTDANTNQQKDKAA